MNLAEGDRAHAGRDDRRKRRRYFAVLEEALAEMLPADRSLVEGKYLRGATVVELATETRLTTSNCSPGLPTAASDCFFLDATEKDAEIQTAR